jgi:hypothetical protein
VLPYRILLPFQRQGPKRSKIKKNENFRACRECDFVKIALLENQLGRPFTSNGFGNRFRKWCDDAGLPHCSAQGLRKAGATIAAENGATEAQL